MSFGFPRDLTHLHNIEEKLRLASEKHTIMFAAASNHGNHTPMTFPASHPSTIAVRSVNGFCTRGSEFNPTHDVSRSTCRAFAVMGENVESTWPIHLDSGRKKQQTGNSVATPILAAIAANVLELVQVQLNDQWRIDQRGVHEPAMWHEIRRQTQGQGIRRALGCLAQRIDGGVDFVQPAEAFESGIAWTRLKDEFGCQ